MSKISNNFTPFGDPYDVVLKNLLTKKITILTDKSRPYEPEVKPKWWNDDHYCDYHKKKGHKIKNCIRFKHVIQYIIHNEKVRVDGFMKNKDHTNFKKPLPKCEKGEIFKKNNGDAKVKYTYIDNENLIHMLEPIDKSIHVIRPRDNKHDSNLLIN